MKRRYRIRRLDSDRPSLFHQELPPPSPHVRAATDMILTLLFAWIFVGIFAAWAAGRL